ncbi:MAG: ThuA domain-containing protein [Roseibacillus sp.]
MIYKALCLFLVTSSLQATEPLVYEGEEGIGKGKHIVFLANDHEYRSEQTCPMMAKVLAKHHGFKCTVLFGLDENGEIKPGAKNLPGLEALKEADLMFFFTRFMDLPDEQADLLVDYFEQGGPVVGMRTSTHAFNGQKGKWEMLNFNYKGEDYQGGLGKQVFGITWEKEVGQGHYGSNHRQGCRISPAEEAASHPILAGVGEIHAYSGAYDSPVPEGGTSLLNLQVLNTFEPSEEIQEDKPVVTGGWARDFYMAPSGEKKEARVVYVPFGASEDILDEDARRFFINACLWSMGMEKDITATLEAGIVGSFNPSPYSTGSLFFEGVKPADLAGWDSSIMPEDAPLAGVTATEGKRAARLKNIFGSRPEMAKKFLPAEAVPAGE